MTSKDKSDPNYAPATLDDVANGVRYLQRKIVDLDVRMDDHYHMLRELLDAAHAENSASLYDMYDFEGSDL